ncbi:MAG: discoidin domain-containing protein [Anaerolineae bacterium]|nr:discoidin domain-containing protein [Anaerolineae bacterium]
MPPTAEPATPTPEAGPLNLAAAEKGGRVVSVSDELDDWPASNLIDGYKLDEGEWWTDEPPEFPQTVVLELAGGQARTIERVVLNPWTSEWRYSWVKDFDIYVSPASPDPDEMGYVGSFHLEHAGIDQTFTFDPVQARYVALVITSHYGGSAGITLNEFEVYEAPPGAVPVEPIYASKATNLVAASNGGRIVDYSSQDSLGNWPPDNLIDGRKDTATGWSSDNVEGLQYVIFAFPGDQLYTVSQVVLNPYSDRYEEDWIQDFELWGSDTSPDLDAMSSLGEFYLEQVGEDQTFIFEATELRYIALVPVSNYGGTEFALNELEVYEAGAAIKHEPKKGGTGTERKNAASLVVTPAAKGATRPPESPPEASGQLIDYSPKKMASSASPVDNIEYEIEQFDLVPVIYHLYGAYLNNLVVTTLTNRNDQSARLRVETAIPNYTETAVDTLTLAPGETVEVAQNPPLIPAALDLLHNQKNVEVHVRVDYLKEGEQRLVYEGTAPLTIYSRGDFPWNIPGYYNGTVFLATLVMPNDPALDELMRAAADYIPGEIVTLGYDDELDSDHSVWERMKAIYEAVSDYYDVIYVAVGTDFVPREREDQGFTLQRLKLPYEVLETRSGMCVEMSTLFASAFEKIGLRPILITVPGHVYVAVPISWDSNIYYFLEGTMVGRASFEEAVQIGSDEFMDEAKPYIEEDRLDDYYWLDVSEARQEGIWPIPWR